MGKYDILGSRIVYSSHIKQTKYNPKTVLGGVEYD